MKTVDCITEKLGVEPTTSIATDVDFDYLRTEWDLGPWSLVHSEYVKGKGGFLHAEYHGERLVPGRIHLPDRLDDLPDQLDDETHAIIEGWMRRLFETAMEELAHKLMEASQVAAYLERVKTEEAK